MMDKQAARIGRMDDKKCLFPSLFLLWYLEKKLSLQVRASLSCAVNSTLKEMLVRPEPLTP